MSAGLIKQLEHAVKRQRSGGKKKAKRKAKRKSKSSKRRSKPRAAKVVYKTRTVVKHVHHRPKAHAKARRPKAAKKRKAKKKGKLSKRDFLERMAAGRRKAKRARGR